MNLPDLLPVLNSLRPRARVAKPQQLRGFQRQVVTTRLARIPLFALLFCYLNSAGANWQAPLNAAEVAQVSHTALSSLPFSDLTSTAESPINQPVLAQSHRSVSGRAMLPDTTEQNETDHPLGTQLLLIELQEIKNHPQHSPRVAEVFLFDYQRGKTIRQLIDVERNTQIAYTKIDSVHLPLNESEIAYSKSLVWGNSLVKSHIETEILEQAITGINGLPDLQAKVSIWVPGRHLAAEELCHVQRCALISIFTSSNYNFSLEPVINLMSGEIFTDRVR